MKILKIIHGYPPLYNAGSEVYSQSVCNELSKRHEVVVFTREENPYQTDFRLRRVNSGQIAIYFLNKRIDKDNFKNQHIDKVFAQVLDQTKPDIAHIGHLNHLSTGIVGELKKRKIPVVFTLHDFWLMCPRGQFLQRNYEKSDYYRLCDKQEDRKCALNCYNYYFSGLEADFRRDSRFWASWVESRMAQTRAVAQKTDLFLAPSRYLLERFVNDFGVPRSKIRYLDYGFPTGYLKPSKRPENETFTFGYIGTHIVAKGINLLIRAFSGIEAKARLKIWGRTNGQSTSALKREAQKSKNRVEFCGEYDNRALSTEIFPQVDCIVVPSIWSENSPLVIHEAQACHVPVITANFGGMKEYVQHLKNGLLFEHRNPADLQAKMQFALENRDLMRKIGKAGYLYSPDGSVPDIGRHCHALETIYQSLINCPKTARK